MLQTALRGHRRMQNVLVGSALHGSLPTGSSETSVLIADPAGRSQRVPVKISGNLARWTYTETMLGGAYPVTVGDTTDRSQLYAVNLDTSESRLERFDPDGLPGVFRREPAADGENGPKMQVTRPFPLFRYVLAGVLALLLCEMTLACLFGRATTGSSW